VFVYIGNIVFVLQDKYLWHCCVCLRYGCNTSSLWGSVQIPGEPRNGMGPKAKQKPSYAGKHDTKLPVTILIKYYFIWYLGNSTW